MFCSIIWVTEFSTTCAEAPGYTALTVIVGGATVGYMEIGRLSIDSVPASMIRSAITQAKIGRSIK